MATEPADFDFKVRQRGINHLASKGISLHNPLPPRTTIPPYWRDCLDDLYDSYDGICAYLCIQFERVTGTASTDHFVPKSAIPKLAYEWSNYRLACLAINAKKGTCQNVLDPFCVKNDWFRLELLTGRTYPNPSLSLALRDQISNTIKRLDLNKSGIRKTRVCHFQDYIKKHISSIHLQRYSPFVYMEAKRQGLL